MNHRPTIALAIPAYNESGGIGSFLRELDAALAKLASRHTFVVVDDCSTDDTAAVVDALAGDLVGSVELITSEENRGHGPTVVEAYQRSLLLDTDVVVQVDGDGQFEADDLELLVDEWRAGSDVVTGNRRDRVDPWYRLVVTAGLRWLLRIGYGVNRRDVNCPFRLYRSDALAELLTGLPPDPLVPHVELTVLESRAGLGTREVDVRHRVRRGGDAMGSTWEGGTFLAAPAHLARFCVRAGREVLRFGRNL